MKSQRFHDCWSCWMSTAPWCIDGAAVNKHQRIIQTGKRGVYNYYPGKEDTRTKCTNCTKRLRVVALVCADLICRGNMIPELFEISRNAALGRSLWGEVLLSAW